MSLIELNGVEKSYQMGEMLVQALKGVDLSIREQEFMAVVGPSGSGKSTLLNLIGTIDEPTAGSVSLKGQDVNKLKDNERTELRNRTIGFVFQRFNLVPVLTALENVSLPLELQGIKAAEARKRALAALEEVGLAAQVRHRPDQLSGG
ncbi:MAG: ATP-binding cassette domain-containing protein, partial [Myxococcaceae bacterium]